MTVLSAKQYKCYITDMHGNVHRVDQIHVQVRQILI